MKIFNNILKEFVDECSRKLNLKSIIQFGSSTYSKNFDDVDLILFSNKLIFSTGDYEKLLQIIKYFEDKYEEIVFDIASGNRLRDAKYKISIVPFQGLDLKLSVDSFLVNNLCQDKSKKILFGKSPFKDTFKISNKQIIIKIILEVNFALRSCLDTKTKKDSVNFLFKTILRAMLSNVDIYKKEDLLLEFKKNYPEIKIPEDSEKILSRKINLKSFQSVLRFSEDCINFLLK